MRPDAPKEHAPFSGPERRNGAMRPNDAQSLASRSPLAQYRFVWDWCCTLAPGMNAGDNPDVGPAVAMITTQDESACSSRPAMLTGAVNIAVFAAFWPRVGRLLLSNAEFKPVCRICELDVSRYGWQKRQDPARSGNEVARSAAKTARMGGGSAAPMLPLSRLQAGTVGTFATICGCSRCWRRRLAPR